MSKWRYLVEIDFEFFGTNDRRQAALSQVNGNEGTVVDTETGEVFWPAENEDEAMAAGNEVPELTPQDAAEGDFE